MTRYIFLLLFTIPLLTKAQEKIEILVPNDYEKAIRLYNSLPLIDIRTKNEFEAGHIKRAINIDYQRSDFEEYLKLAFDKSKPLFVYCQTGQNSSDAALFLTELGFSKVTVLKGGFEKWISSSKPYKSAEKAFIPLGFITKENYVASVKENKWVLVDFYADWCAPCKKMAPILSKIDADKTELTLLKIDADKNTSLTESLEISEIPTLILYKNGRQIWRQTGLISAEEILSKLF